MNAPERARILEQAAAAIHGAQTLLLGALHGPSTALPLVYRSWQYLAWLSRGEVPEGPGESLADWLASEHLAQVPTRAHARLHANLRAAFDAHEARLPWAPNESAHETTNDTQTLPETRVLLADLRILAKLLAAFDADHHGPSQTTRLAMRWAGRAALGLLGVAALVAIVARPWQSEDVGPWRGAYYPSKIFEGRPDLTRERDVGFDWKDQAPTDSIPSDHYSARFDTCLVLEEATDIAFMLTSDNGSRLRIDGQLQIDNWAKRRGPSVDGTTTSLAAGVHHLQVEYFEDRGEALLHLTAAFDASHAPAPIPAERLRFPGMDFDVDEPCARVH